MFNTAIPALIAMHSGIATNDVAMHSKDMQFSNTMIIIIIIIIRRMVAVYILFILRMSEYK